jgi:hypothetical protein
MADAQTRLLTYRNEYTFNGVECIPLMYKVVMCLATINLVATTQPLRDNLQLLRICAATASGNIDKYTTSLTKILTIDCQGATIDNPAGILFEAYLVGPCHNIKMYIRHQHEDDLDGKLIVITYEALMASAKRKYNWLKMKGLWRAKSPDGKKIVAMTIALNALKGQLKLEPKLSSISNEGNKKGNNKGKKKKNKKNMHNRREQKKDEG